jgi:hypothetical protein
VLLEKGLDLVAVRDELLGAGLHRLDWFFHFDIGIEVTLSDCRLAEGPPGPGAKPVASEPGWFLEARGPGHARLRLWPARGGHPLVPAIDDGWVSRRYGVKRSAPVLRLSTESMLPVETTVIMYPSAGAVVDREQAEAVLGKGLER